jgi:hypothetical protein
MSWAWPAGKDPGSLGTLVSIAFRESRASGETLPDLVRRRAFDGVASNVGLARLHRSVESSFRMSTTCCT